MLKERTVIYLSPLLFITFFLYMIPVIFTAWLMISTDYFIFDEPDLLNTFLNLYIDFEGLPNDVTTTAVHSIPSMIGAICYRRSSNKRLNCIGWILFVGLLVGAIASIVLLFILNPNDSVQWSNVLIGKKGLERLHADIEASLRTVITYILLFLGLKVSVQS